MPGLKTIIKKQRKKEKALRLLCLGLDNAGKTTVVRRCAGRDISEIAPTLGFQIMTLQRGPYSVDVWDVGGQQTIRSYWCNYFDKADGLVWVIDSADRRRMNDCKKELHSLLGEEKLAGASLLILANKQDLAGALSGKDIGEVLELGEMSGRHWRIQGCSAVTGEGLEKGMDWLVEDISNRVFLLD